jgi:hypothetical protein
MIGSDKPDAAASDAKLCRKSCSLAPSKLAAWRMQYEAAIEQEDVLAREFVGSC